MLPSSYIELSLHGCVRDAAVFEAAQRIMPWHFERHGQTVDVPRHRLHLTDQTAVRAVNAEAVVDVLRGHVEDDGLTQQDDAGNGKPVLLRGDGKVLSDR